MSERLSETEQPADARRTGRRGDGAIWGGLALLTLGVVFLLQRVWGFDLRNWWALFILIPAFSSFAAGVRLSRHAGRLSIFAINTAYGGLIPLFVAIMFLFELSWARYWPVFIILAGGGMLLSGLALRPSGERWGLAARVVRPWLATTGFSALLLGVTFLLRNLGMFDPASVLTSWWSVFILIPALGGLIATVRLAVQGGQQWALLANLIATIAVAAVGVVALLSLNWDLLWPLIVIAVGVVVLLAALARR